MVKETLKLDRPERFSKPHVIDKEKLEAAAKAACAKLKARVEKEGMGFPSTCSKEYKYAQGPNNNWECGMYTGCFWLAYQLTGDEFFKNVALEQLKTYYTRWEDKVGLDDHDVGFVYLIGCVPAYKLAGDKGAKELLPPYYEDVLSVSDGEFIVRIRGALGIVKSDGAGVVDPLYSEIVSMGENGYIAWDGDRHAVIIEDGVIIHNDAVQSVNTALSFTFNDDEELSVSLWTTVSIGGKLLIHRSSAPAEEINNSYVPDKVDDSVTELNDRAKVVYYYDGNVLCHAEVIHPQHTSFTLIDSPNGKGWYATTAISTQTIPVTEEYVISYDGHIIRLYSKR